MAHIVPRLAPVPMAVAVAVVVPMVDAIADYTDRMASVVTIVNRMVLLIVASNQQTMMVTHIHHGMDRHNCPECYCTANIVSQMLEKFKLK